MLLGEKIIKNKEDFIMSAFELDRNTCGNTCGETENVSDLRRLREECIIALKVYDSCRQQLCYNIHQYTD